jgi:hypothetical protein
MKLLHKTVIALLVMWLATSVARGAEPSKPAVEMATAGSNFFNALSPEQQQKASFAFADDERLNWAFVPKARKGLPFKEMTPPQREAAVALIKSGLSERGFEKADTIMNQIEMVLRDIENGSATRDSGLYYVTLFGKPEASGTWGWRIEGHHVAFNFTIVDGNAVAGAPNFLGSNPATVQAGPKKGRAVLGVEEDLGRKLVTSLSEEQRKTAIIAETAPRDITTATSGRSRPARRQEYPPRNCRPSRRKSSSIWFTNTPTVFARNWPSRT